MMRRPPGSTLFPYTPLFLAPTFSGWASRSISVNGTPSRASWPLSRRRSEEHTSELQSHSDLVCRLPLENKKRRVRRVGVDRLLERLLDHAAAILSPSSQAAALVGGAEEVLVARLFF